MAADRTTQEPTHREYFGQRVVGCYSNPGEEWDHVRSRVGWNDLGWRKLVSFTGSERAEFLHGMTTNHVTGLAPGTVQNNTVCDVTGHLVGVMRLMNLGDFLLADLHPGCAEAAIAILDKHLIMEDMQITPLGDSWKMMSIQGPRARDVLGELMGSAAPIPTAGTLVEWPSAGQTVYVAGWSHTGENGFDFLGPAEAIAAVRGQIEEGVQEHGGGPVGLDALNTLRVEAGIPWWGEDLDNGLLMLEAGLADAIHFQKGCYLGQETLARVHHRGHTNRQLMGLLLEGAIPARDTIVRSAEKEAGRITSAVVSPALQRPVALGLVRREFLAPGTLLHTEPGGQEAWVEALPFL